jgi:purine-binding chemotaxis protein CheW
MSAGSRASRDPAITGTGHRIEEARMSSALDLRQPTATLPGGIATTVAAPPAATRTADTGGAAGVAAGSDRYLTFVLGGEVFALPILDVTEIMEYRSLTVVPMMPPFIRGVINLRGRVVPVVDMAARFGRGRTDIARRTGIVIVETPATDQEDTGRDMGMMVDAVNKVVHLSADEIEPPPAFGAGIRSDFIAGMAKHNGHFIIVLDISRVLSLDEMVALGQAVHTTDATPETADR